MDQHHQQQHPHHQQHPQHALEMEHQDPALAQAQYTFYHQQEGHDPQAAAAAYGMPFAHQMPNYEVVQQPAPPQRVSFFQSLMLAAFALISQPSLPLQAKCLPASCTHSSSSGPSTSCPGTSTLTLFILPLPPT